MTSIIDRLVEQKLVLRKKSESDRRLTLIYLSAEGQRLYVGLVKEQFKNTVAMLSSLSPAEQATIAKVVNKVANSARAIIATSPHRPTDRSLSKASVGKKTLKKKEP